MHVHLYKDDHHDAMENLNGFLYFLLYFLLFFTEIIANYHHQGSRNAPIAFNFS